MSFPTTCRWLSSFATGMKDLRASRETAFRFVGFYILILQVNLGTIPTEVYEVSALDGPSRGHIFRFITLSQLRNSLALALILCVPVRFLPSINFTSSQRQAPEKPFFLTLNERPIGSAPGQIVAEPSKQPSEQ